VEGKKIIYFDFKKRKGKNLHAKNKNNFIMWSLCFPIAQQHTSDVGGKYDYLV